MPLAAGMDDTSIRGAKEYTQPTKVDVTIEARWDDGSKVELDMVNLDPGTIAELIPWLRERRVESKERE